MHPKLGEDLKSAAKCWDLLAKLCEEFTAMNRSLEHQSIDLKYVKTTTVDFQQSQMDMEECSEKICVLSEKLSLNIIGDNTDNTSGKKQFDYTHFNR